MQNRTQRKSFASILSSRYVDRTNQLQSVVYSHGLVIVKLISSLSANEEPVVFPKIVPLACKICYGSKMFLKNSETLFVLWKENFHPQRMLSVRANREMAFPRLLSFPQAAKSFLPSVLAN